MRHHHHNITLYVLKTSKIVFCFRLYCNCNSQLMHIVLKRSQATEWVLVEYLSVNCFNWVWVVDRIRSFNVSISMKNVLVGNVVDMLPTCCNVVQMSKIFEIDTNVHDTEKFFILSHVTVACRGHKSWVTVDLLTKKYIFGENIFLTHKRYQISRVFIC